MTKEFGILFCFCLLCLFSILLTDLFLLPCNGFQFVSDTYDDWPFSSSSKNELSSYSEVTDVMIDALISEGILKDFGIDWSDKDEPDKIYVRDIRNVWMDNANSGD